MAAAIQAADQPQPLGHVGQLGAERIVRELTFKISSGSNTNTAWKCEECREPNDFQSVAATSAWMWHYVTMCGDCIQAQGKGASIKARLHAQTIENQKEFIIFLKMNFKILILHVHSRALFKSHFVREPPARSAGNGCHGGAKRDKDLAAWRLPPSFSWWTFPWTHSDLWLNG